MHTRAAIKDGSNKSGLVMDLYIVQQPSQSIEKHSTKKKQPHKKQKKQNQNTNKTNNTSKPNKQTTWKMIGGPVQELVTKAR
jgi:microcompartment protein CcmL/EutN